MTDWRPTAVLCDLLMAVLDSPAAWAAAAGGEEAGWSWRDGVTRRMIEAGSYAPYEQLVSDEAAAQGMAPESTTTLLRLWAGMEVRPDAGALARLAVPYAFVTNCSERLAGRAAEAASRECLRPAFVLSAEEAGWYKPKSEIYLQACTRLAPGPHEVLYVAGAAYDAEGALAAGLSVALVARRSLPDNLSPAIRRVASLPEALAETP
jgi:beta-phosphoglucomutase-like phosphatase (HAD superfamily)